MSGTRPLRLLLRLKLRGKIRKQLRRLRSPKAILLALFGVAIIGLWFSTIALGPSLRGEALRGRNIELVVRIGALALVGMTITASLAHRGLYMPAEELERLLSGPVRRSDLVRYRILANLGRYSFSGVIFGLILMRSLPAAGFGFFGVLVSMLTLPLLSQLVSLLAGAVELRLGGFVKRSNLRYLHLLLLGVLVIAFLAFLFGEEFAEQFATFEAVERLQESIGASSTLRWLALPLTPWTRMVLAKDAAEFLPWLATSLAAWVVLFELTARMPFDFRELTLETSADVARRIRRAQRTGFGASSGKAVRASFGRRIPWLFGRSPAGAMAWLKLAAILRKTRGTVTVSILIIALMTAASLLLFPESGPEDALRGGLLLALVGTIYLCSGLRFDFRTDLDQMEAIKSWPISPRRAFLANLLPEVLLVSTLLTAAIGIRVAVTGGFHPALLGLLAALPLIALAWVALDNAVFLFAPVRTIAGQEGVLLHMGRSMVLLLLRLTLAAFVFGPPALIGWLIWLFSDAIEIQPELRIAFVTSSAALCLFLADFGLVYVGGWALRRFDVSRIPR